MSLGRSVVAPVAAALVTGSNAVTLGLGGRYFDRLPSALVERLAPKPGTGPSEQTREKGHYRVETYTTTSSGARYVATMAQQGDPGYKATAVLLGSAGWPWRRIATNFRSFAACSRLPPRWVRRCWRGCLRRG